MLFFHIFLFRNVINLYEAMLFASQFVPIALINKQNGRKPFPMRPFSPVKMNVAGEQGDEPAQKWYLKSQQVVAQ